MSGFAGFPREALAFYEGPLQDNSKAYWEANKAIRETRVRDPMVALLAELEDVYGPFHRFRPYRDTRFSKPDPVLDRGIRASHSMRKWWRRPSGIPFGST